MTASKPRGAASLLARLNALQAWPTTLQDEARAAELLAQFAAGDDEHAMLRQMLGFDPYTRKAMTRRHSRGAVHGTAGGVEFHEQRHTPLCRLCARWVYAHEIHGTEQSCQAHYADREPLCGVCQAWSDAKHARANIAPGASCGSPAGWRRHRRLGERVCAACQPAESAREAGRPIHLHPPGSRSTR